MPEQRDEVAPGEVGEGPPGGELHVQPGLDLPRSPGRPGLQGWGLAHQAVDLVQSDKQVNKVRKVKIMINKKKIKSIEIGPDTIDRRVSVMVGILPLAAGHGREHFLFLVIVEARPEQFASLSTGYEVEEGVGQILVRARYHKVQTCQI